jgi:superfamily II RNA helicase
MTERRKPSRVPRTDRAAGTCLKRFRGRLGFELDPFQAEACRALEAGQGVLVAAPTGSGKTVVGEFAAFLALERGLKAFYTTPIKALSNQKFSELTDMYGSGRVGLLTGDVSINPDADVVVMTTEVLRNMLYVNSAALAGLGYVVMDEVHYLADRVRGAVWEEIIIHLPAAVRLVALSATVSNAEEFGAWLETVRGDTAVVISGHRPVPLHQHVMVGTEIVDLFATPEHRVNPELLSLSTVSRAGKPAPDEEQRGRTRSFERDWALQRGRPRVGAWWPRVIRSLEGNGLLPAIGFIFSRAGCDAAVRECAESGMWLTTVPQRREILRRVDAAVRGIPEADLRVLGFAAWRDALRRGFAAHHAGMVFVFREVVEKLFADGLVRAVFATETLALGINMPARSVVLEKLEKFNGEFRTDITAGEYTQLTGRAGRRGIDTEGHAVVLWRPGTDPAVVAGLASERTYPLISSFRPTYNMSVNLIAEFGRDGARELLENSFAQFQADRSAADLAQQVPQPESEDWELEDWEDAVPAAGSPPHGGERIRRTFDRLCDVLLDYGYLEGRDGGLVLGTNGHRLRRIYGERDLLVSLCIGEGAFDGLDPAELAGLVTALVYRPRTAEQGSRPRMPSTPLKAATNAVIRQWTRLRDEEEARGLTPTLRPQLGLVRAMHRWAGGGNLESVLHDSDVAAGDFIHWAKRTVDLLDQLAKAEPMPPGLDESCREASGLIRRGAVIDQASLRA